MEIVRYEPKAAIASHGNLKSLLERSKERIADVAPKHVSADRILKLALVAATKNPQLLRCTQESVLLAVMQAAEIGVDISGTRGEAWLVPYGNECQLQIGYMGLVGMAFESGEVRRIEADVVHENDRFIYVKGTVPRIEFEPAWTDRGKIVGVYCVVELTGGGIVADRMNVEDVERIRRRSKSANSPAWKGDWGEMAKKTVWRRLSKYVPISSDRYKRAEALADAEYDLDRRHAPSSEARALNARLGLASDPVPEPEDVDEYDGMDVPDFDREA